MFYVHYRRVGGGDITTARLDEFVLRHLARTVNPTDAGNDQHWLVGHLKFTCNLVGCLCRLKLLDVKSFCGLLPVRPFCEVVAVNESHTYEESEELTVDDANVVGDHSTMESQNWPTVRSHPEV